MNLLEKEALRAAENYAVKHHKPPAGYDEATLPTLAEIESSITCGSVLLCSGTSPESRLIELVNGTDFSHVAMVVRLDDSDELLLWTADQVHEMKDQIDKEEDPKHPGTHLLNLREYVSNLDNFYKSPDGSKYRYAVARLEYATVNDEKLDDVMDRYDGTPFPSTKQEFGHFIKGVLNMSSGMSSSFCSQLVAKTYQDMKWLKRKHPANHYNPGDFAKTEKINKDLMHGVRLGEPEYFKV